MSVIPCGNDKKFRQQVNEYADFLKIEAHKIGSHGLSEQEFYDSGLLPAAIEKLRGQKAAAMREKRQFVTHVLNHMQDHGFIQDWESAGGKNRHDYTIKMPNGRVSVIELKGCMDGNNTTIFERPPNAREFIIWSICTGRGSDPQKNVWSGIHTRLSAEIIDKEKQVDGLVVWDWACGTPSKPCPKLSLRALDVESLVNCSDIGRRTEVGPHFLTPPCIYMFPSTVPSVRNNPSPKPHGVEDVEIINAFVNCFEVRKDEINYVDFQVEHQGSDTARITTIRRNGEVLKVSRATAIRRS